MSLALITLSRLKDLRVLGVALLKPFCNLTNIFFLISPNDYSRNLTDEIYGCIKHVGMSYDMVMRLPIQERRSMIRKHNMEQDQSSRRGRTRCRNNGYSYGL